MSTDLILGTAGHIDHGKTALIGALTGTNTDRLPEEKRRGITIELGFAQLPLSDAEGNEYRLGVVDVPGHEKFVRQMLAGATGMDVALLVVAADDSVKPQTREHVEVLRMLDLRSGVIALTKCDLADPDWVELVEAEVRELVAGSFLEDAPIVHTSVVTQQGIEELRGVLATAAKEAAEKRSDAVLTAPFRMAIDRTFTMAGHGAVVTGSVVSGQVNVGDELEIQPGAIPARVRSIQNHDQAVDSIHRGQRAAINLAGIHHDQIRRGHELAAVGHLRPSQLVTVRLNHLSTALRPLKHRDTVRVHIGTAEILATVSLLSGTTVEPGSQALAQFFLREPVASVWKQPFVLRCESPMETIGGGHILVPCAEKMRRVTPVQLERLQDVLSEDLPRRVSAALHFHGLNAWEESDLVCLAGLPGGAAIVEQLLAEDRLVTLPVSPTRTARLERDVYDSWAERLDASLARFHEQFPLRSRIDRSQMLVVFDYLDDRPLLNAIVDGMVADGKFKSSEAGIARAKFKAKLSARQLDAFDAIVGCFRESGFQPPAVADCEKLATGHEKDVEKLLRLAVADGQLVHIEKQIFLHADAAKEMQSRLTEALNDSEGLKMSEIRELLETTRKYAVPFCEYLDRTGFTERKGDVRVLAK